MIVRIDIIGLAKLVMFSVPSIWKTSYVYRPFRAQFVRRPTRSSNCAIRLSILLRRVISIGMGVRGPKQSSLRPSKGMK